MYLDTNPPKIMLLRLEQERQDGSHFYIDRPFSYNSHEDNNVRIAQELSLDSSYRTITLAEVRRMTNTIKKELDKIINEKEKHLSYSNTENECWWREVKDGLGNLSDDEIKCLDIMNTKGYSSRQAVHWLSDYRNLGEVP